MISERQLARMGLQVRLVTKIGDVVPSQMMPEQGDHHDERHDPAAVILDAGEQFGAIAGVEAPPR